MRSWIGAARTGVDALRGRYRWVDEAFEVQARDWRIGGNLLACAIAYRFFLWLLPMALLIVAGLGFSQAAGDQDAERTLEGLKMGRAVISAVSDAAVQAEQSRWIILALGLFALYSAGSGGAKTMVAVHRIVWDSGVRTSLPGPVASVAFSVVGLMVFGLALVSQWVRSLAPGTGVVAAGGLAVLDAGGWLAISMVLPHGDAPWTRLLPGAAFVGIGMQAVHLFSVFYLQDRLESSSELYGGLGAAAVLLLGLYLVSRLVVAAAVINARLWERERRAEVRHEVEAVGVAPET